MNSAGRSQARSASSSVERPRSGTPRRSRRSRAPPRDRSGSRPRSRARRSSRGRTGRADRPSRPATSADDRLRLGKARQVVEIAVEPIRKHASRGCAPPRAPSAPGRVRRPRGRAHLLHQRAAAVAIELVGVLHRRHLVRSRIIGVGGRPGAFARRSATTVGRRTFANIGRMTDASRATCRADRAPRCARRSARCARGDRRARRAVRRGRADGRRGDCAPRRARCRRSRRALRVLLTLPFRSEWDTRPLVDARSPRARSSPCPASTAATRMLDLHAISDPDGDVAPGYQRHSGAAPALPASIRRDDRLGAGARRRVRRCRGAGWAMAAATTIGCCRCCRAGIAARRRRVRRAAGRTRTVGAARSRRGHASSPRPQLPARRRVNGAAPRSRRARRIAPSRWPRRWRSRSSRRSPPPRPRCWRRQSRRDLGIAAEVDRRVRRAASTPARCWPASSAAGFIDTLRRDPGVAGLRAVLRRRHRARRRCCRIAGGAAARAGRVAVVIGVGYGPITPASSEVLARTTPRDTHGAHVLDQADGRSGRHGAGGRGAARRWRSARLAGRLRRGGDFGAVVVVAAQADAAGSRHRHDPDAPFSFAGGFGPLRIVFGVAGAGRAVAGGLRLSSRRRSCLTSFLVVYFTDALDGSRCIRVTR